MHGTMILLMALSGLGCHHRRCNDCAPVVQSCYGGGMSCMGGGGCYGGGMSCYGGGNAGCYGGMVATSQSCYGGGMMVADSCYGGMSCMGGGGCYGGGGGGCYGGRSGCGLFGGGGGMLKHHGGLFHRRRSCSVCSAPVQTTCDPCGSMYGGYAPAMASGQDMPVYGAGQGVMPGGSMVPNEMAPPNPGASGVMSGPPPTNTVATPPTAPEAVRSTEVAPPANPAPADAPKAESPK